MKGKARAVFAVPLQIGSQMPNLGAGILLVISTSRMYARGPEWASTVDWRSKALASRGVLGV